VPGTRVGRTHTPYPHRLPLPLPSPYSHTITTRGCNPPRAPYTGPMTDPPTCPSCQRPLTTDDMRFLMITASETDLNGVKVITNLRDTLGMRRGDRLPEVLEQATVVVETLRERVRVLEGRDA